MIAHFMIPMTFFRVFFSYQTKIFFIIGRILFAIAKFELFKFVNLTIGEEIFVILVTRRLCFRSACRVRCWQWRTWGQVAIAVFSSLFIGIQRLWRNGMVALRVLSFSWRFRVRF